MKENGFTDEVFQKQEKEEQLQFGDARVKDLNLPTAVTVPSTVSVH